MTYLESWLYLAGFGYMLTIECGKELAADKENGTNKFRFFVTLPVAIFWPLTALAFVGYVLFDIGKRLCTEREPHGD